VQRDQRGAIGSAVVAVAACLLVGVGAGYAVSELTRPHATDASVAVPMSAGSPSVPTVTATPTPTPTSTIVDDRDDYAPLDIDDLTFDENTIATSSTTWSYEAPAGWERKAADEAGDRWVLPGNPDFTYSLRVNPITLPSTTADLAQARYNAIAVASGIGDPVALEIGDQEMRMKYVSSEHQRYQHSYFISPPGSSTAVFEVTVSGRMRDMAGLDDLLEYVVASVHKV